MKQLTNRLKDGSGRPFDEFKVQILMRCIECCLHEPFGEVNEVKSGSGAAEGGACFANVHRAESNLSVPEWLVIKMNERARSIILSDNTEGHAVTKSQLKLELKVLGLEWSKELDCLVHKYGIRKKLDSSDTEHLMCMFNRMIQRTLPNQNTSENHRHDNDWCLPVAFWKEEIPVSRMGFMRELMESSAGILEAYKSLLNDKGYVHCALRAVYQVDMIDT